MQRTAVVKWKKNKTRIYFSQITPIIYIYSLQEIVRERDRDRDRQSVCQSDRQTDRQKGKTADNSL